MNVYRIFSFTGSQYIYIEYSGIDLDTVDQIIDGKRVESIKLDKMKLKYTSKQFPDLLGTGSTEYFISDKLKKIFDTHITRQEINYVAVSIKNKPYSLLNIIGLRDCMDYEASEYTVFKNLGTPHKITKLVLRESEIESFDIFRLKDAPLNVFITESLKNVMEKDGITGVEYVDNMDMTYH